MKKADALLAVILTVYLISSSAAASYLDNILVFIVCSLARSFRIMGYSIGMLMFVYGAVRYVYTADDPGGRKQAIGVCIAAVIGMMIIAMASTVIASLRASITGAGAIPAAVTACM